MPDNNLEVTDLNREEVDRIIDRASYLRYEADMLKKVIDQVPYDEQFSNQPSIMERLNRLDLIQTDYLQPILQAVINENASGTFRDIKDFHEELDEESPELNDIQVLLEQLTNHRKEILDKLKALELDQWNASFTVGKTDQSLAQIIYKVVDFERDQLSKIADQVMVYSQQRSAEREIEKKQRQHNRSDSDRTVDN